MSKHQGDTGDTVEVHNRPDKVVLVVTPQGSGSASTTLTPAGARQVADALRDAADAGERTPAAG